MKKVSELQMARQRDETKPEMLLDAALTEIARSGLSEFSIDAVARRGRVAPATIYIYFKNKEALIDALYTKVKLGFSQHVFVGQGLSVRIGIEAACNLYLNYCRTHARELIFLDQIELSPQWRDLVSRTTTLAMQPLIELLERGKSERIVKNIDNAVLIAFLANGLQASAQRSMELADVELEQRHADIISLCWSAIAA